ncbi:hypothetical protein MYIN104542_29990 [Mycobacterium intermedium]
MAAADGPCQAPPTSPAVTASNEAAADPKSAANPSQANAAVSNDSVPAPLYINEELISGGSTWKFTAPTSRG